MIKITILSLIFIGGITWFRWLKKSIERDRQIARDYDDYREDL